MARLSGPIGPPGFDQSPGYRTGYISLLAAVVGLLAGFLAFVLYKLIAVLSNLTYYHQFSFVFKSPRETHLGWWIILMPVLGGIIVGLMEKYGSRKIEGHGIPEAMEAVLVSESRIEGKVAVLKPLSAAIAIGTGGPFGAEGPIIQTGGAFGSLVGQIVATTAAERKVLLACGAGAGMAATFNTPIAGVIIAIELLLFEFRARSFIPLVIATTLATSVHQSLLGPGAMFHMGPTNFRVPAALPYYLLLGIVCGFAAVGFTKFLYWVEDQFDRLPIDKLWYPAIGALGLGLIGYFVPRVLGVGYDTISDILNNSLTWHLLLLIVIFKSIALAISLGSGTSGGLLAPMFMASAALGGVFAMGINRLVPGAELAPGAFALVAMGGVFGAAARAAFAFIVFAFEITRDYNSVLPLMLVCVIADAIAIRFLPYSIMTEKLARHGVATESDYEANPLKGIRVAEIMARHVIAIQPDETIRSAANRFLSNDPQLMNYHSLPIVDKSGRLAGIITQGDILRALHESPDGSMTVIDAGTRAPLVAYPDQTAFDALTKMILNNIGRLPVVNRDDPQKMIGYLTRTTIMACWGHHLQEELEREPGWLQALVHFGPKNTPADEHTATGQVARIRRDHLELDVDHSIKEFVLLSPPFGIVPGDTLRITYSEEGGRFVAHHVERLATRQ